MILHVFRFVSFWDKNDEIANREIIEREKRRLAGQIGENLFESGFIKADEKQVEGLYGQKETMLRLTFDFTPNDWEEEKK